ncbi:MAG: Enoyl-[acyl-carrier-protein] reductase [NADH], partial [uncultured Nocardioides sp.]
GNPRRQAHPGGGGHDGLLHRLRHGQGRPGAGRDRAHLQLRPCTRHHEADRQAVARDAARARARRHRPRPPGRPPRRGARARRRPGRRGALHRLRQPRDAPRREVPRRTLGRRRPGDARLGVLAEVARHGVQAADGPRVGRRRTDVRRHHLVAGVRLDGRGEGRPRVHLPLPRPLPRPGGHPGQPGLRRSAEDDRRQGHPGVRGARRHVVLAGPARLGQQRPGADRARRLRAAVGLLPGDDRRDRARRRRLPRHGGL